MAEASVIRHNNPYNEAEYIAARNKIIDAQEDLIEELGETPSMTAIAKRSGVHVHTVRKHFREMRIKDDILPKFNKYAVEVLNRHLELARQNENKKVALEAVLTLEEKLFDMIDKRQVDHTQQQTKTLKIEVEDRRKQIDNIQVSNVEVIEVADENKSST